MTELYRDVAVIALSRAKNSQIKKESRTPKSLAGRSILAESTAALGAPSVEGLAKIIDLTRDDVLGKGGDRAKQLKGVPFGGAGAGPVVRKFQFGLLDGSDLNGYGVTVKAPPPPAAKPKAKAKPNQQATTEAIDQQRTHWGGSVSVGGMGGLAYLLGTSEKEAQEMAAKSSEELAKARALREAAKKNFQEEKKKLEAYVSKATTELKRWQTQLRNHESRFKQLEDEALKQGAEPSNEIREELVVTYEIAVSAVEREQLMKEICDLAVGFIAVKSARIGPVKSTQLPAFDFQEAVDQAEVNVDEWKHKLSMFEAEEVEGGDEDEDDNDDDDDFGPGGKRKRGGGRRAAAAGGAAKK